MYCHNGSFFMTNREIFELFLHLLFSTSLLGCFFLFCLNITKILVFVKTKYHKIVKTRLALDKNEKKEREDFIFKHMSHVFCFRTESFKDEGVDLYMSCAWCIRSEPASIRIKKYYVYYVHGNRYISYI